MGARLPLSTVPLALPGTAGLARWAPLLPGTKFLPLAGTALRALPALALAEPGIGLRALPAALHRGRLKPTGTEAGRLRTPPGGKERTHSAGGPGTMDCMPCHASGQ